MSNIGIVFAGAASKGAYEIGCLKAIEERFGAENIKYISSASIGALIAQTYGMGKLDILIKEWRALDVDRHGKFFLSYAGNQGILDMISKMLEKGDALTFEHYVSVWNYTQRKVEYVPFHKLADEQLQSYMRGAIAIPIFSNGELINGDRILDGAFLDNIPVYPLVDKNVDYIFCIYFDNFKYTFENEEFDSKIIKVFDFPNDKKLELMTFKPANFDSMIQYGYDYMINTIDGIFTSDDTEKIYEAIAYRDKNQVSNYKPRFTADVVLNNINVMTKHYSKRISNRIKEKSK